MLRQLTTILLLMPLFNYGQSSSLSKPISTSKKLHLLSKGINLGYRAGLDQKNHELLVGYYIDFANQNHRLVCIDANAWTNFKRLGGNTTISIGGPIMALSFSNDVFKDQQYWRYTPGLGIGIGANDLLTMSIFYHQHLTKETDYPVLSFKLMIRPAFFKSLAKNPDGSDW